MTFDEVLSSVRMPLFFLVSGLFAASSLAASQRSFVRRKVAHFLWIYAVWAVLHTALRATLGRGNSASEIALGYITLDTELWYLIALLVFFTAARLLGRVAVPAQLAGAATLSVLFGFDVLSAPVWTLAEMGQHFVYFLVGCHASAAIRGLAERVTWPWTTGAVAAWAAAWLVLVQWLGGGDHVVSTVLPLVAVPAAACLAVQASRASWSRPGVWLGRNTLPTYVMHSPVIAAVWPIVAMPAAVAPPVITMAVLAVTVMAGLLLRRVPGLFELPGSPGSARRGGRAAPAWGVQSSVARRSGRSAAQGERGQARPVRRSHMRSPDGSPPGRSLRRGRCSCGKGCACTAPL